MVKVKHKLGGRVEMMDEKYAKILVSLGKVQIVDETVQNKVISEEHLIQQKTELIEKSEKVVKPVSKRNTAKPKETK